MNTSTSTTLTDSFGQVTEFTGKRLGAIDTFAAHKPSWWEVEVYRTEGGSYVVHWSRYSNLRHQDPECTRLLAGGAKAVPADLQDYPLPCKTCGPGRWGASDRISVDAVETAPALIKLLVGDVPNNTIRAFLAELSEVDDDIYESWMRKVIL